MNRGVNDTTTLHVSDPEERAASRGAEDAESESCARGSDDDWDDVIADVVAGLEGMDALSVGLLIMRMGIWLEEPTPEHREGLAAAARLLAKQMTKNEP